MPRREVRRACPARRADDERRRRYGSTGPAPAPAGAALAPRPINVTVYEICGGRVRHSSVRSALPVHGTRFVGAPRMPHATDTLAAVRDVATRCAPWLRVYLGPALWTVADDGEDVSACSEIRILTDGRVVYRLGGQAWTGRGVVLVGAWCSTQRAVSVLHHEVWHAVELRLAVADFVLVDRAAARGVPMPGSYLASAVERRARLYSAWGSAYDEGWRPGTIGGWPVRRLDRIFAYVHGGGMARDIARRGVAREQTGPLPRALRAAGSVYRVLWC